MSKPPNLRTAACCGSCCHSDWERDFNGKNCTKHEIDVDGIEVCDDHAFEPNPDPDGDDKPKPFCDGAKSLADDMCQRQS